MARNRYTRNETILCTYIARFGRGLIDEEQVATLYSRRTADSVRMKVQNIARMLNEEGYRTCREIHPWGGGYRTDWHIVQRYASRAEPEYRALVRKALALLLKRQGDLPYADNHQRRPAREASHSPEAQSTPRMKEVVICIPEALICEYDEAARQLDISRSSVLRRAVERGLPGAIVSLHHKLEDTAIGLPRGPRASAARLAEEAERRVLMLGRRLGIHRRSLSKPEHRSGDVAT